MGGAVPGVPPELQPKPSPRVDAARAAVGASPSSVEAHVDLGWALVDAEGWIDAYREAETILEMDSTSPDGRVISAAVRIVMGQKSMARTLVDEALGYDPKHIQALSYSGMLSLRAGDREAAAAAWEAAKEAGGDPQAYDELIELARSDRPLPGPKSRPGHPPSPPAETSSDQEVAIAGTIRLGKGAEPPPGGAIFVIARLPGVTRGPPAATRKYPPKLPLAFSLGADNVMMGGPFPNKIELTIRWDADGNAMTRGDTDLWGAADDTLTQGTTGVEILLN
jgi:tetratricopeptide (TPR) repeat protein